LPGERRLAARQCHQTGVNVSAELWTLIQRYAHEGSPMLTSPLGQGSARS
jgi:hypothetical protein